MAITTVRKLLTDSWAEHVEIVETAVGQFRADRSRGNDSKVVLFEMAGDRRLHVNVIHKQLTKSPPGWAGPGKLPMGFVHNRTFSQAQATHGILLRHVREMIFAEPAGAHARVDHVH